MVPDHDGMPTLATRLGYRVSILGVFLTSTLGHVRSFHVLTLFLSLSTCSHRSACDFLPLRRTDETVIYAVSHSVSNLLVVSEPHATSPPKTDDCALLRTENTAKYFGPSRIMTWETIRCHVPPLSRISSPQPPQPRLHASLPCSPCSQSSPRGPCILPRLAWASISSSGCA